MSAVRKWIPAHTRALMLSSRMSESRRQLRVVPDLLLVALIATLSVPKKERSVPRIEPAAQLWPDGCSGNGGVTSGGPEATGVERSNNGVHSVSAVVAGLPSSAASRMAVIGRQAFQWYLSFQQ